MSFPMATSIVSQSPAPEIESGPRFTGPNAKERYLDWLMADARFRIRQAAATPPIDCEELYVLFVADPNAVYDQLAGLGPKALVAQAFSMAGYLGEILGMGWQAEDILECWQAAMARRGVRVLSSEVTR
jgi:hypothetical protein